MVRITTEEAARRFTDLINRVRERHECFDLEHDHEVVARLVPANQDRSVEVKDLNNIFRRLPELGEDAAAFRGDVASIRGELPNERDPWD